MDRDLQADNTVRRTLAWTWDWFWDPPRTSEGSSRSAVGRCVPLRMSGYVARANPLLLPRDQSGTGGSVSASVQHRISADIQT
jgi:hypothetical protein